MPDFTGFDFIQSLTLPKLAYSSYCKKISQLKYQYECIVDYLVKPITESFQKKHSKAHTLNSDVQIIAKPTTDFNLKEFLCEYR
jgi:hypothetical protein